MAERNIGRPTHSSEKRPDQKDRCKTRDHRADEPQGCAVGGDAGAIQRQVSPEEVYDANGRWNMAGGSATAPPHEVMPRSRATDGSNVLNELQKPSRNRGAHAFRCAAQCRGYWSSCHKRCGDHRDCVYATEHRCNGPRAFLRIVIGFR